MLGFSGPDCAQLPATTAPTASVAEGVVPLGVFFDASEIGGMANNDFLNAHIVWQFGDTGAGTYEPTGKDKNVATGFVAAHVFEQPGTYQVVATVMDTAGTVIATSPITITAREFSGESRCVSVAGNFTGAPAGCDTFTTSDIASHLTWLGGGSNRRLLLRRGEEWNVDTMDIVGDGPSILGAFGTGAKPRLFGAGVLSINGENARVMDIECSGIILGIGGTNNVVLRAHVHDTQDMDDQAGVGVGMGGHAVFLADSTVVDTSYFSVYTDGSQVSITGSSVDQIRVATSFIGDPMNSRDIFITNNLISASRANPTTGIKWHSRRGVITDNILTAGMSRIALTVDNGETLTPVDEGLGIVLIERNLFRLTLANESDIDRVTSCGVAFTANRYATIRNNLMRDMSRAFCNGDELAPARDISIYNNSAFKGTFQAINHDEGDFILLTGNADGLRVFNNIMYTDNTYAGEPLVRMPGISPDELVGHVEFGNNIFFVASKSLAFGLHGTGWASLEDFQTLGLDTGSRIIDPQYQSVDIDSNDFLMLEAGSPAINMGADVPVYFDYRQQARDSAIDISAFEVTH